MMKTKLIFMFFIGIAFLVIGVGRGQTQSDNVCSDLALNPDNEWASLREDLEEAGIPADLWAQLNSAEGIPSLEDFGITADELNAFLTANGDKVRNLQEANPLKPYLNQALAIMGNYGLGEEDIAPLLDVRNDMQALFAALGARGLSSEQAQSFLSEISPLVQEASRKGLLKYALVADAEEALDEINPTLDVDLLLSEWDDLDSFEEEIIADGYDEELVRDVFDYLEALELAGLDPNLIEGYQIKSNMYLLELYGVPTELFDDVATTDEEILSSCFEDIGLDAEAIDLLADDFEFFDETDLEEYYAQEMADFLYMSELSEEELAELLALDEEGLSDFFYELYDADSADFLLDMFLYSDFQYLSEDDILDYMDTTEDILGEYDDTYTPDFADDYLSNELFDYFAEADDAVFSELYENPDTFDSWLEENFIDETDDGELTDDDGELTDDDGELTDDSGETTDDSGETTDDGGETTDDSGETIDDGGETTDDSGETTDDGGETTDDGGE